MSEKLTANQREILQLMTDGVHTLQHHPGVGNFMREYFDFEPTPLGHKWREDMRTILPLGKRGLIVCGKRLDEWGMCEYDITDAGRAALAERENKE
jgi:hypothetical protein